MKAIYTKYLCCTNHHGSRIKASDSDGNTVTIPYDHAARNPHALAAVALCRKLGWTGRLMPGAVGPDQVFVFVYDADIIEVNK